MNLLDVTFLRAPDADGYSANLLGLWRRKFDQFSVYSFQPDVLAGVTPQLRFEESPHDGQVWARIGDVLQARIATTLNNWGYSRTRETALGDLRLMQALNQQLHVPPERCKETAESLLAAKLICPLGEEFVLRPSAEGGEPLDFDGPGVGLRRSGIVRRRAAGLPGPAAELVPRPEPGSENGGRGPDGPRRGRHAVAATDCATRTDRVAGTDSAARTAADAGTAAVAKKGPAAAGTGKSITTCRVGRAERVPPECR